MKHQPKRQRTAAYLPPVPCPVQRHPDQAVYGIEAGSEATEPECLEVFWTRAEALKSARQMTERGDVTQIELRLTYPSVEDQ